MPAWTISQGSLLLSEVSSWVHEAITNSAQQRTNIYLTARLAVGIRRLAIAIARMRISNSVTEKDLQMGFKIAKECYETGFP